MKIPLDFFLKNFQNFARDIGLDDVAQIISSHIESDEGEYDELLKVASFQNIVKFFISSNPQLKKMMKKKLKDMESKYEMEEYQSSTKLLNKKTKRNGSKKMEEEDEKEEAEVMEKKERVNTVQSKKKKSQEVEEIQEINFIKQPKSVSNDDRKPFKRINDSLKDTLPDSLKNNSYEEFMKKTGDDYGKVANEKLKFTKGRDFKKEKTKFKNKASHGGYSISTTVRSIPLEDDD